MTKKEGNPATPPSEPLDTNTMKDSIPEVKELSFEDASLQFKKYEDKWRVSLRDLADYYEVPFKQVSRKITDNREMFRDLGLGAVTAPTSELSRFYEFKDGKLFDINLSIRDAVSFLLTVSYRRYTDERREKLIRLRNWLADTAETLLMGGTVSLKPINASTQKASVIVTDCFEIAETIHAHFGVDKTIASVHLLNGYKPEMIQAGHSGNIEPIIQLLPIPAYDEDEAYLTATAIGSIVGLSNRVVNRLLKEWGYQVEKTRVSSDGKIKPDGWQPTPLGFSHGGWKMNSDGHNGGKLYVGVQWRWKASILRVFEEKMGIELQQTQSTLFEGSEA